MKRIKITTIDGIECVIDTDDIMSTSGRPGYSAAIHMRGNNPIYSIDHDELKRVNAFLMASNSSCSDLPTNWKAWEDEFGQHG